ncbi:hypothetical protein BU25DRAFT_415407 [Macroventuria anomochaeta]|uniref:Uncharacterized protein n=1 Tax=Macroventuria anomochaeta TaxID=301207 RepID=A0ACB6RMV5_9PLEO|nr:uncharacterized protein BU25DRAFT_415407 [Macroventuria anomochaeta]KAF2622254.1 hypothetical protein BU25DRAFT_415407 [Macroventuria anomochaeta]
MKGLASFLLILRDRRNNEIPRSPPSGCKRSGELRRTQSHGIFENLLIGPCQIASLGVFVSSICTTTTAALGEALSLS